MRLNTDGLPTARFIPVTATYWRIAWHLVAIIANQRRLWVIAGRTAPSQGVCVVELGAVSHFSRDSPHNRNARRSREQTGKRTALEDPKCSSERLANVVRTDPVLNAQLLMAAKSAFHNRAGIEIIDLHLAISRLGFEVVRNTATTLAVEQIFTYSEHEDLKSAVKTVWSSSPSFASMSFVIARNSGSVNHDSAFLCGLLHEVGKLYILTKARNYPALIGDDESLAKELEQWSASVGKSKLVLNDPDGVLTIDENEGSVGKLNVSADTLPGIREAYDQHAASMRP